MNIWEERNWRPMLLGEVNKPFNDKDFLFELKFDGIRATIYANSKEIVIKSRYGKDITHLYPELQKIKVLVKNNTIFDGEIIAIENGKPSFSKLQTRSHLKSKEKIDYQAKDNPIVFLCFDLLYDNEDITNLPLIKRKTKLNNIKENKVFIKSFYVKEEGKKLFSKVQNASLEGIVAKKKDSVYLISQRTKEWLKIKNFQSETFIIGGYLKNKIDRISLFLGEKMRESLFYVGKVVLYTNNPLYKEIENSKIINQSPFFDYNQENVNYLNPILECNVSYMERTKNNQLRQPFLRK